MLYLAALLLALYMPSSPCAGTPDVTFRHYTGDFADLREGYCMGDPSGGVWFVTGLIAWQTYQTPSPVHFTTRALWQSRGVIEMSSAYHGVDLSDVFDGVALMSPADVGRTAWVRVPGGPWYKVRSGDAAAREHLWYHVFIVHSGIELGYELALELGAPGGGLWGLEVCVTEGNPDLVCAGVPVDYETWFRTVLRYE